MRVEEGIWADLFCRVGGGKRKTRKGALITQEASCRLTAALSSWKYSTVHSALPPLAVWLHPAVRDPWHLTGGMMQHQPWSWSKSWCNGIIQQLGYFRSTSPSASVPLSSSITSQTLICEPAPTELETSDADIGRKLDSGNTVSEELISQLNVREQNEVGVVVPGWLWSGSSCSSCHFVSSWWTSRQSCGNALFCPRTSRQAAVTPWTRPQDLLYCIFLYLAPWQNGGLVCGSTVYCFRWLYGRRTNSRNTLNDRVSQHCYCDHSSALNSIAVPQPALLPPLSLAQSVVKPTGHESSLCTIADW